MMEHRLDRYLDQVVDTREPVEVLTRTEELMREHGYLMREWRAAHTHIEGGVFLVVTEEQWRDELNRVNARLHQIQIELDQERLREEMKVAFATIDLHHEGISKCYQRIGAIEAELTERDEALANSKAMEAQQWVAKSNAARNGGSEVTR